MPFDVPDWVLVARLAESYAQMGDPHTSAARLVAYGDRQQILTGAQRLDELGDAAAAGAAYLQAAHPHAALDCFRRAGDRVGELRCWQALGDAGQIGTLLLELDRPAEARAQLEQALTQTPDDPASQARLGLHLARALYQTGEVAAGYACYQTAHRELGTLPADVASADAWIALGQWGVAVGRVDRTQEGYAQALRLLEPHAPPERQQDVAMAYRDAARAMGNRRLVAMLDARLAALREGEAAPLPPDPARALLDHGQWQEALDQLQPHVDAGDEVALQLLAKLPETDVVPLQLRLAAAALLGAHNPRLLDIQTGNAGVDTYWCQIEAGPFWSGAFRPDDGESEPELQPVTLPYHFRLGRYPVTNCEYARFIAAGGYQEQRWWTEQGWAWKGDRTQPHYWEYEQYNAPNQPVVGVAWFEAAAYCIWLTEVGHTAGWLPQDAEIRLPTSLEWERAARHTDQRRYPWGDTEPTPEHANYAETGIGQPSPVGCFPAGAAVCGALDLSGNVTEWMATPADQPGQVQAGKDVPPDNRVLASCSGYQVEKGELVCGSRIRFDPIGWLDYWGFRVVQSLRSSD